MPETTYMAVDPRRDHSLRVPRPDLSVELRTPNACTGCHLDHAPLNKERRSEFLEYADWVRAAREGDSQVRDALDVANRWAADAFQSWYGTKNDLSNHFANALLAAHSGDPSAERELLEVARNRSSTPIVRSTSLIELGRFGSPSAARRSAAFLADPDPQVRAAALGNLQMLPDTQLVEHATPLLRDPTRVVRAEAGRVLARVPRQLLRGPDRRALQSAVAEFEVGLLTSNDRATAHLSLGILYESQGAFEKARQAYQVAILVEPGVTGPRSNLAALYDRLAVDAEQQATRLVQVDRQQATQLIEKSASYRALSGQLREQELPFLARDAKLAPSNAPIQYRYGLSLYLHGQLEEAEAALLRAVALEPNTHDFPLAVALLYQKQSRFREAIKYCERVVQLRPNDATYRQLLVELRQKNSD